MEGEATSTVLPAPTPEQVLGWIAAAAGTWFPARHAASTGILRDSLDRPLNELRAAELIRVVEWVRGTGQGYVLTPQGELAAFGKPQSPEEAPPEAVPPKTPERFERPPIVTPALVYANLLWFFVGSVMASRLGHPLKQYLLDGDRPVLMRLGAAAAPEFLRGEWWRLATACFVHGHIWHLLMNMVILVMLGAAVEHVWGRGRTFILYLVAGFAGTAASLASRPLDANGLPLTHLGASGALCGFFTALLVWVALYHHTLQPGVTPVLLRRLAIGVVFGVAVCLLPGLSWEAHLGGAAAGLVAAILLNPLHKGPSWRRPIGVFLVALMPAACFVGLLTIVRSSEAWAPLRSPPAAPVTLPDPNPHLNAVSPEGVKRGVKDAATLLMTSTGKSSPERVKQVRAEIAALQSNAAVAAQLLAASTGDAAQDAQRAKARAFADARRDSLNALLKLIDRGSLPSVEEWKAWGESHNAANRLWDETTRNE